VAKVEYTEKFMAIYDHSKRDKEINNFLSKEKFKRSKQVEGRKMIDVKINEIGSRQARDKNQ
jgi:hypothetical protein